MKLHSAVILLALLPSSLSQRFGGRRKLDKSTPKPKSEKSGGCKANKSAKVCKAEDRCCPEVERFHLQSYGRYDDGYTISYGRKTPDIDTEECGVDMCTASWMLHFVQTDSCELQHAFSNVMQQMPSRNYSANPTKTMLGATKDWNPIHDMIVGENLICPAVNKELDAYKDLVGSESQLKKGQQGQQRNVVYKESTATVSEFGYKDLAANNRFQAVEKEQDERDGAYKFTTDRLKKREQGLHPEQARGRAGGGGRHGGRHGGRSGMKRMRPRQDDFDLVGTLFINKGDIKDDCYSHYSVACTILEADITGLGPPHGKNDGPHRGLGNGYPMPMVEVTKASCDIDVCLTSGNFDSRKLEPETVDVEQDCFYLKYSGAFRMEFPLNLGGGNQRPRVRNGLGESSYPGPSITDFVATLIGGTGKYRGATGVALVSPQSSPQDEFDIELVYTPNPVLVDYIFGSEE